ncbi:hypothetical protein MJH12_17340 [bacterium]|nr:hypothetical protein [bacterium]
MKKLILFYLLFISDATCKDQQELNIKEFLKTVPTSKSYYLEPSLQVLMLSMEKQISSNFYRNLSLLSKTLPLRIENHMGYLKILPFSFIRRGEVLSLKATIYSAFDQGVFNKVKDSDRFFINCKLSWKRNAKYLLINLFILDWYCIYFVL